MSPMASGHSYAGGRFALELEGVLCGFLKSVSGGGAAAKIGTQAGMSYSQQKTISHPKLGELQIECGAGMTAKFFEWIKASMGGLHGRKSGSIITLDFDYKERERREFTHALITEISFPACDASSRDPAFLTVRFKPEAVRIKAGDNSSKTVHFGQKHWTMNNFRFAIPGIDCSKVNKVEPPSTHCPNLVVTMAESHAKPFYDWHQNFVIKGNEGINGATKEGTLAYLTPGLQELFILNFHNLGIFKVSPEKVAAHGDNIRRVKVEMYTERIDLKYNHAA